MATENYKDNSNCNFVVLEIPFDANGDGTQKDYPAYVDVDSNGQRHRLAHLTFAQGGSSQAAKVKIVAVDTNDGIAGTLLEDTTVDPYQWVVKNWCDRPAEMLTKRLLVRVHVEKGSGVFHAILCFYPNK